MRTVYEYQKYSKPINRFGLVWFGFMAYQPLKVI